MADAPVPVRPRRLGPLGRRLVLAFSLTTLVAVSLLALAAQQAVDRGFSASRESGLWTLAAEVGDAAAAEYSTVVEYGAADGWAASDLRAALALAHDAGARAVIRDTSGAVVAQSAAARGPGASSGGGSAADVVVDGVVVGSVEVGYQGAGGAGMAARAEARGRDIAWSWIVGAAAVSLILAVLAGWALTRWLTGPLTTLTTTARSFALGDHTVRATDLGPGELGDLARGFNEAAESMERSAQARRQMAADVAHELRTPLTALQAGLEELRDGLVEADTATLSRLHDQSLRLGRVVADLGILATADDLPSSEPGRADLAQIVREELAARTAELRAAGVAVGAVDLVPVLVLADSGRIHQVVGNLLANCARHCRPGDHVEVTVGRDGADAVLRVSDDGPGIAAADLPHVMDRYWRGADTRVSGSGLGLAVVQEIVTAHRGTLEVTSTGGTTVTIRVPELRA